VELATSTCELRFVGLGPPAKLLDIAIAETDFIAIVPAAFVRVVSPFSIDSGFEDELG